MKYIKSLYFWILLGFISGSFLGLINPNVAILMQPLGTNFIKLIKLFIGPIVFFTVAVGIVQTGSLKKLGKIGTKTFIYFEVVSSLALLIGWFVASIIQPGKKVHANLSTLDKTSFPTFLNNADQLSIGSFFQNLIPSSIIEPFAKGDMLQILFMAMLFGVALLYLPQKQTTDLIKWMKQLTQSLFKIIGIVMYAAPLAIFGSMAFTIAKFGSSLLVPLLELIIIFYITGLIFIFVVLGSITKIAGFSIVKLLKYIAPELLLVLGTASSESALPALLNKLEQLGCKKETVGVVVPLGYSFNLDGTNIYITLSALFIAQALGIQLTLGQEFTFFITAMLLSKGASGVTGAGFITLAATLSTVPSIPVVGIVLILGIDRFMSEARSLVNFIGNTVASLIISRWEKEISSEQLNKHLG